MESSSWAIKDGPERAIVVLNDAHASVTAAKNMLAIDDDDKRPNHRALLERAALEGKKRCKSGRPAMRSLGGKSGMGAISDMLLGGQWNSDSDGDEEEEGDEDSGAADSAPRGASGLPPRFPAGANGGAPSPEAKPATPPPSRPPLAPMSSNSSPVTASASSQQQPQPANRVSLSGIELPPWLQDQAADGNALVPGTISDLLNRFATEEEDGPIIRSRNYARKTSAGGGGGSGSVSGVGSAAAPGIPQQSLASSPHPPPPGPSPTPPLGSRALKVPLNASFAVFEDSYSRNKGGSAAISRQNSGSERNGSFAASSHSCLTPLAGEGSVPLPGLESAGPSTDQDLISRLGAQQGADEPLREVAAALIRGGRPPRRPLAGFASPAPAADVEDIDRESGALSRPASLSAMNAVSSVTSLPPLVRVSGGGGLPPVMLTPPRAPRVSFAQAQQQQQQVEGGPSSRHCSPGRAAAAGLTAVLTSTDLAPTGGFIAPRPPPPSMMRSRDASPSRSSSAPRSMAPSEIVAAAVAQLASGGGGAPLEEPEPSVEPSLAPCRPPRPSMVGGAMRNSSPARVPFRGATDGSDDSPMVGRLPLTSVSHASPLRASRDSVPLREMMAPREPPGSSGYLPDLPAGRLSRDASPSAVRPLRRLDGRSSRDASPQAHRGLHGLSDDPPPARQLRTQDSITSNGSSGSAASAAPSYSNPLQDMPGWRQRLNQPPKVPPRPQRDPERASDAGLGSAPLPQLTKAVVFIQPEARFDLVPEGASLSQPPRPPHVSDYTRI